MQATINGCLKKNLGITNCPSPLYYNLILYFSGCIELLGHYNLKHGIYLSASGRPSKKPRTSGPFALATSLSTLVNLLSEVELKAELRQLEEAHAAVKSKDYFCSTSTGTMIELWGNQFSRNTFLGDLIAVLPKSSITAATLQFQIVQNAMEVLVPMSTEIRKIDVIRRAF